MKSKDILQQAEKYLQELSGIIQREQQAIVASDIDELHAIIKSKNATLDKIGALEPSLPRILKSTASDDPDGEIVDRIKELLLLCRERNTENSRLTVQGLNVLDKSIGFLESLMQIGSVRTYGPTGKTTGPVTRRNIGTA